MEGAKKVRKQTDKLTLNQETIRNLNPGRPRNLRGPNFLTLDKCPTTTNVLTCVECNPPCIREV